MATKPIPMPDEDDGVTSDAAEQAEPSGAGYFQLLSERMTVRTQDPKLPLGQGPLAHHRRGAVIPFDDTQRATHLVKRGQLRPLGANEDPSNPNPPPERRRPRAASGPARLGDAFTPST